MPLSLRTACLLVLFASGCSWQGAQSWKRSVCEEIVDSGERAECLEEANRPEKEYREDVREATGDQTL